MKKMFDKKIQGVGKGILTGVLCYLLSAAFLAQAVMYGDFQSNKIEMGMNISIFAAVVIGTCVFFYYRKNGNRGIILVPTLILVCVCILPMLDSWGKNVFWQRICFGMAGAIAMKSININKQKRGLRKRRNR